MNDEKHAAMIALANQGHAAVLALEAQWRQEDETADLHMSYRFYQSEDGTEWLLRTWEPDYPATIRFTDIGPDRAELMRDAEAFWRKHIEPKRAQRQEAEARRERDRLEREAKKAAKAGAATATAA